VLSKNLAAVSVAAVFSLANFANAAVTVVSNTSSITIYEDQAQFAAAAGTLGTDSFDDLTPGDQGIAAVRQAGSESYTIAAGQGLWGSEYAGNRYLSVADSNDLLLFSGFSAATRGLGGTFFGSNDNGEPVARGAINVTVTDATGVLVLTVSGGIDQGFVGFLSTAAVQAMTLQAQAPDRYFPSVDDIRIAAPVPEPSTAAMMLMGAAVLPLLRRRKEK